MPFRRRRYPKRKRKAYKSKTFKTAVKKIIDSDIEHKFYDTSISYGSIVAGSTPSIHLTSIVQGAGDTQRIGNEIKITSVSVKMTISNNNNEPVRILLVRSKVDEEDTAAPITHVLYSDNVYSHRDFPQRRDYNVVMDRAIMPITGVPLASASTKYVDYYHKFKYPVRLTYNGSGGGDISTGALFLYIMTGEASADQVTAYGTARVVYVD